MIVVLLSIVLISILIIAFCSKEESNFTLQKLFLVAIILISLVAFRGEGVDHDYNAYVEMFNQGSLTVEPSFILITNLLNKYNFSVLGLFFIYAVLGVSMKLFAIRKFCPLPYFSICIYIGYIYILQDFNQIRAGVASGIFLYSLRYLVERKVKCYLLMIFLASLFHYSAILLFFFFGFSNKSLNKQNIYFLCLLPILGYFINFIGVNFFINIPIRAVQLKLEMYRKMQETGVDQYASANLFNAHFLFKCFVFYALTFRYSLLCYRYIYFPLLIKVYAISLFVFPVFSLITPIAGYRFNELIGSVEILLFPLIFYLFKPIYMSKLLLVGMSILLFCVSIFYKQLLFI